MRRGNRYRQQQHESRRGNDRNVSGVNPVALPKPTGAADLAAGSYGVASAAVSGADPIEVRPGFAELLARIADNGVHTIIVETANRFARDLMVQEVGYAMLRSLGVTLVAADSPSSFLDDGPTSNLIRQILGAVSEFDKAMTVAKLKDARDRVRRAQGKCEGRKTYAEREGGQELVALARQRRGNLNGQPQSLRKIAADLAERGCVTPSGRRYSASAIASMLGER